MQPLPEVVSKMTIRDKLGCLFVDNRGQQGPDIAWVYSSQPELLPPLRGTSLWQALNYAEMLTENKSVTQ